MTDARQQLYRGLLYAALAGGMAGTTFFLSSALDREHAANVAQFEQARAERETARVERLDLRDQLKALNAQLSTNQTSINRVLDAMGKRLQPP